jgi:hypothetical protein
MAEILGVEIADYVPTGRTSITLMGLSLSKTPMAEMLGVKIADYFFTGRTLIALIGQPLSKTPMAEMLGVEIAHYSTPPTTSSVAAADRGTA